MRNLVYDVFGRAKANQQGSLKIQSMSSCRGWSRIVVSRVVKMSSCRGWSKICVHSI